MKQTTTRYHYLERFGPSDQVWHRPEAGLYAPAKRLANCGHFIEAIDEAYSLHLKRYGSLIGVEFRVVTESTTITEE